MDRLETSQDIPLQCRSHNLTVFIFRINLMLLAYAYCFGTASEAPEMCIIPSKPDQFSCIVRVRSLIPTTNAICRLSPTEGMKVFPESEKDTLVIEPIFPSKLYITPSQPDRPGLAVLQVRLKFHDNNQIEVWFKQVEKDLEWKPWHPNELTIT